MSIERIADFQPVLPGFEKYDKNILISPIQGEIVKYIFNYTRQHSFSPTIREISENISPSNTGKARSTGVVNFHLDHLRDMGLVIRQDNNSPRSQARTIRLSENYDPLFVHIKPEK